MCDLVWGHALWYLVTGVVGLEVKGVWGLDMKWKLQCKMWWTKTFWFEDERGNHIGELEVEWILTEDNYFPGLSHMFWRKSNGRVIYTSRLEHPPPPRIRKEQVVMVLHRKSGVAKDGAKKWCSYTERNNQ